ncbi:hypothetical protein L5515_016859 [Caenorhabditis briggsae]|uniref:Uncharacterized protein n=1 Tax=Caenorhabditis briggsae TaxID=6238 RepID=A0AAE9F753_CAEBR|nr:hypothetical protein L5515_016859 [Caenorhabditis briggsae]
MTTRELVTKTRVQRNKRKRNLDLNFAPISDASRVGVAVVRGDGQCKVTSWAYRTQENTDKNKKKQRSRVDRLMCPRVALRLQSFLSSTQPMRRFFFFSGSTQCKYCTY